jgi:hypothetical protein
MPRIGLITPVYHAGLDPYHVDYDNLPLRNIIERQNLINSSLEDVEEIIQLAKGTQGDIANRLAQSIDENGDLISTAIDQAYHKISEHEEDDGFVIMTSDERAKLEEISPDATALKVKFGEVEFDDDTVIFNDSETVSWEIEAPNIIKANFAFPAEAAHEHHYNQIPSTTDYTSYETPVEFIEDSLRVYVNGIRIPNSDNGSVYVYNANLGPSETWLLTNFNTNDQNDGFTLNRQLNSSDIVLVDFDRSFI